MVATAIEDNRFVAESRFEDQQAWFSHLGVVELTALEREGRRRNRTNGGSVVRQRFA